MGKWVDNRESEISDLLWSGIDSILGEIAPVLDAETGAFDGATNYKNTVRGKLHKKLHDEIWSPISKQLDGVEEDINTCVEVEIEKKDTEMNSKIESIQEEYQSRIDELKDEIEAWKADRIGKYKMNKNFGL